MIDIYRGGAVVISVHPSDNDKVTKKVMGENTLSLSFTLANAFDFKIGDYLYFAAEKYTLNITPELVKRSTTMFDYTLLFEGIEYELRKVRLLFATEAMGIGGGADFSLMGNAALFAQVIVANLNRVQTGWTVGSVIESETKNLTFAGDSCLTAINKVVTEFDTEFWIGQDKTVNIGKKGSILPVVFEYGLGNGLYSITRTNVSSKDIITRLYPFGSEQNLPKGYRGNAKRLQIAGDYIEANVSKYDLIESSENFDVKPERTGTITALGADIFTFIDSSMDFDLNAKVDGNTLYLVPGTTAKIHFQSGDLAGYEFELSSYDHATKAFKLIEFTNEIAYKLPNATLKPAVGDTYIILDIYMPQTYVDAAEARLLAKAQESLAQNSEPQVSYKVAVDPQFVADKGLTFASGDYVGIKDTQLLIDRDIRLVSVTRNINQPDQYEFDLADTVEPSLTTQILTTLDNTDIVIRQNKLIDPARARRNYKATAELVTMIEVLKAEALLIGNDPAAQFDLSGAVFNANANGDINALSVSSSVIAHNYYPVGNPGTWSMPDYVASALTPTTAYRLYVRASQSNATAMYVISATVIGVEDEQGYYHFPVGILSSVIDGARVFQTTKGYTLITGDSIKTGTFVNKYGQTVLSLDDRTFYGSFTFANGKSVETSISDAVDNLQIGGRNLIRDSKGEFLGSSQVYNFVVKNPALSNVAGKTFTLSAEACVTEAGNDTHVGLFAFNASWQFSVGILSGVNNGSWEHISVTFTVPSDFSGDVIVGAYNSPSGNGGSVALRYLKLEEGNKATGWTPAPEDVQADITTAQDVANASAQKITDMAADGKITPVEKKSISQLVDQAMSEVNDLVDQADAYGVFRDTYQDTYYDLLSFTGPFLSDMLATSDVVRATLEQMFSSYNYAKVALLNNISNAINGTATTAKNAADDAAIIARAMSSGKMLNRDPNFKSGWNGINPYNNNGGTALVVSRNAAESDSPNYPDGFDIKLSYVGGSSGTQPGLGGFTFATQCRANAVFLVRIIAYIPVGYSIEWTSNAFGTGGTQRWLTTTNGEGKFKEYLLLVRCGSSGTFSTTNFFYLTGPTAPVNWWLCFATVYDTTSSEAYVTDAFDYLKEAMANDTNVTGGLIATSILKLGAVNQAGTWIEKAGISGVGSGNVPRVWTGGALLDAINRIAGSKTIPMFVATEEGEFFADKGEIGGFDITPQGIEKEQSITDNGVTFVGKFAIDWMNQAINFFRDGVARVLVSAKAITSGIPTPSDITVAAGTWKDLNWFPGFYGQTIGDRSILGPRNILTPGGYTAKNVVNLFLNMPQWEEGEVPTWQCYLNVTLNIWKTDAANAKTGLLCSITKSVSLTNQLAQVTLPVSFSLDISTGISHEIYVSGNDTSYKTLDGVKYALRLDRGQSQQSMLYSAQLESLEIGYSGFRIMATNLWCYFNTKDNANKHFRLRGNAELVSKSAIVTANLDDDSFRASTILLQGINLNILNKTANYTIVAADRAIAGLKNVNPSADCTFTLPSLSDIDTNGVYYNNNRVLTFVSTTRNLTLAAASGQNIRNAPTYVMGTNVGYSFLGDRASLQWLIIS